MNEKSKDLLKNAYVYAEQLSNHVVLNHYWNDISLVLKGSVSRGNSDQYSDIDFVLFCDEAIRRKIIDGYLREGLTDRSDGVFIPIDDWVGHYHFESFEMLHDYFTNHYFPQVWEFQNAIPLTDPSNRFSNMLTALSDDFLKDPIEYIKDKYLDMWLTLDWKRQPLRRGDSISASLHCSKLLQDICRMAYLLDGKSYPHDKWVSAYLSTTRFGSLYIDQINQYLDSFPRSYDVIEHLELDQYPCFVLGMELIQYTGVFIKENYDDFPWIERWYEYV